MKLCLKLVSLSISVILFSETAWPLSIVSPKEAETVYAGSKMTIIVQPAFGEEWQGVLLGFDPLSYNPSAKDYRITINVPEDLLGSNDLSIIGVDKSGSETILKVRVLVKVPPNVVLESINVNPNPVFLEKLPLGSDPDDLRVYGTKNVSVAGNYSDGVQRKLISSATGTIYASSNENVVTVSPEGKITAQGIGKTTITVRNGKSSAEIRVIVDPYKDQCIAEFRGHHTDLIRNEKPDRLR